MIIRFLLLFTLLVPALAHAVVPTVNQWEVQNPNATKTYFPISDPVSACEYRAGLMSPPVKTPPWPAASYQSHSINASGSTLTCMILAEWQSSNALGYEIYRQLACPANSTPSGSSCVCKPGFTEQGGSCVPPPSCIPGETVSQGLYSIGTQASNNPPLFACSGVCEVQFDGVVPSKQQVVNGVMNYFAEGKYYKTGESCSGGSAPPGTSPNGLPPPSCAPGQAPGTINDKFVCIDQGTGEPVNPNTPQDGGDEHEDPPPGDPGEPCTPGSSTRTLTYPDGSKKIITTTKNEDCSTDTNTQNIPGPTGGNAAGNDGNGDGEPTPGSGGGGGGGGGGSGTGDGEDEGDDVESGDATAPADLYTPTAEKTFDSIMGDFTDRIQQAPFYAATANFFDVSIPGGGCGGMSGSVGFGGATFVVDLDSVLCSGTAINMYQLLGIAVIMAASWLGFKIAFL